MAALAGLKVAIGCDHAAFTVKEEVAAFLKAELGCEVADVGCYSPDRVDYPDVAAALCAKVNAGEVAKGVLLCGSGIGISIAANKVDGIRAALCHDAYTAQMAREHNDAQVLCAGARTTGIEVIKHMVRVFLGAEFAGGRHADRVAKITALEQ